MLIQLRYSGGGAVYQDQGNTNFTFFQSSSQFDRKNNSQIIVNSLKKFGLIAEASGRNDILVNGLKISGSAFKLSGQRALHHGTMLINVDMNALSKYLNVNKAKLKSKGVDSVRSRVLNLKEANPNISHESLSDSIIEEFFKFHKNKCEIEKLDITILGQIKSLKNIYETLSDWKWRYGESPDFEHKLETRFDWGIMDIEINSIEGIISQIQIYSDCLYPQLIETLSESLKGVSYDKEGITKALDNANKKLRNNGEPEELFNYIKEIHNWLIQSI